jgi:hypothetical protein
LFYLCLSFYALPAFDATLKIRRRKLAPIISSAGNVSVDIVSNNFASFESFAKNSAEKSQKESTLNASDVATENFESFMTNLLFSYCFSLFRNDIKTFSSSI